MTGHGKNRGLGYRFARKKNKDGGGKKKARSRIYWELNGRKAPAP